MKIEEITIKALKKSSGDELKHLRSRCIQVHRFMSGQGKESIGALGRRDLLTKYALLREEMSRRGLSIFNKVEIDEEIEPRLFRKNMFKLDIDGLRDIVLVEKYVSLSGEFVKNPVDARSIDVVIRAPFNKRDPRSEQSLTEPLKNEKAATLRFNYMPTGPLESHIAIYDLVLKARGPVAKVVPKASLAIEAQQSIDELLRQAVREKEDAWMCDHSDTEVIYELSGPGSVGQLFAVGFSYNESTKAVTLTGKPEKVRKVVTYEREGAGSVVKGEQALEKVETTENYHRIPVRGKVEGHAIRTLTISDEKGIKALEDTVDKEIVTYMFDVDKWTLEEAKTWASAHKQKAAFLKIAKADKAKQIIGGIVYEPDVEDTQGEQATADEIEKAMYAFMEKYADDTKRVKIQHEGGAKPFPILECFQADEETKKGKETLKKGTWWVTIKVTDPEIWKAIDAGALTGFSMGGTARSVK